MSRVSFYEIRLSEIFRSNRFCVLRWFSLCQVGSKLAHPRHVRVPYRCSLRKAIAGKRYNVQPAYYEGSHCAVQCLTQPQRQTLRCSCQLSCYSQVIRRVVARRRYSVRFDIFLIVIPWSYQIQSSCSHELGTWVLLYTWFYNRGHENALWCHDAVLVPLCSVYYFVPIFPGLSIVHFLSFTK